MSSSMISTSNSIHIANEMYERENNFREKKQVIIPPMRYDLAQGNSDSVIQHLNSLSISLTCPSAKKVEIFKQVLLNRGKKHLTTIGYIPAPPNSNITRQVIGKDGYFFKMTTALCNVDFIWHDVPNKVFLFWGSSTFNVVKALNSIRWRIHKNYLHEHELISKGIHYDVEYISDDDLNEGDEDDRADA